MRRLGYIILITVLLIVSACSPKFDDSEEDVQENNEVKERTTLAEFNISDEYYQTVIPFKPSEVRGLSSNVINNRFDIDELEMGLMRVAQDHFNPDDYIFQEGQFLDSKTITGWLGREGAGEGQGLNPSVSAEEKQKGLTDPFVETPKYLSHVLEHNYLKKDKNGNAKLAGITIGVSLNTVHYYQVPEYGWPREEPIDPVVLEKEGKALGQDIVSRLRTMEQLQDIPIVVALFKEAPKESIVPGNYFATATVEAGKSNIKKWENVEEKFLLFPSQTAREEEYDDSMRFTNFKEEIETFFPNFIGVIGTGFYKNEELKTLSIKIPIQFYSKAEIIAFTQFTLEQIVDYFPPYINVNVYISSIDGPESIIVRNAGDEDPFVHIYN